MNNIRIAIVIMNSICGKTKENISQMENFIKQAYYKNVDLIVFPEANITGYSIKNEIMDISETIPGFSLDTINYFSEKYNMAILAGIIEKCDYNIYITHFLSTPESGLKGFYRKTHLSPIEKGRYNHGNNIPIFNYKNIKFGIQLCYDTHFPELSTSLALWGAEIIFCPYASPKGTSKEKYESWMRYLPARAFDNSLFVIACNQVGDNGEGLNFPGVALALDPKGKIILKMLSEKEDIMIIDLDSELFFKARNQKMSFFLPNRRDDLYFKLNLKDLP